MIAKEGINIDLIKELSRSSKSIKLEFASLLLKEVDIVILALKGHW